jgi:sporulation protein YlmC with PRC-barrel domain
MSAKCGSLLTAIMLLGAFTLSPLPTVPAVAQTVELVKVDAAVVGRGYRASKLIGSTVKNDRNETIGSIDDIVIDEKGQLYAVLEVGGFLGLGGHRVALPYNALKIDPAARTVRVPGATKEELEKLTSVEYAK